MTTVKRDGSKFCIRGVDRLTSAATANSVMGALAAALHAIGDPVAYDYLMGVSGAAFRIQVHEDGLCARSPNSGRGYPCKLAVCDALDYELEWMDVPEDADGRTALAERIRAGIDRGAPVLFNYNECALAGGYESGVPGFLLRTFGDKTDSYTHSDGWPADIGIIGGRKDVRPMRERVIYEAIDRAEMLAATAQFDAYLCGFAAWDRWIELLNDETRYLHMDRSQIEHEMKGNAWICESLHDARTAAGRFLHSIAKDCPEEMRQHILTAATTYDHMVRNVLAHAFTEELAPYPNKDLPVDAWTSHLRHGMSLKLRQARLLERQAVGALAMVRHTRRMSPHVLAGAA